VLSPEAPGSNGYLQAFVPNHIKDLWVARINFSIGREKFKRRDWINGGGMAIYYLKTKNQGPPPAPNYYGYNEEFDGIGVFITPRET
jgi:hypothetical protein